jgi:hypothetical protein
VVYTSAKLCVRCVLSGIPSFEAVSFLFLLRWPIALSIYLAYGMSVSFFFLLGWGDPKVYLQARSDLIDFLI